MALYEVVLPPAMPPLTVAAGAFVTVGAAGQNDATAVHADALDHIMFVWHERVPPPAYPELHVTVTVAFTEFVPAPPAPFTGEEVVPFVVAEGAPQKLLTAVHVPTALQVRFDLHVPVVVAPSVNPALHA